MELFSEESETFRANRKRYLAASFINFSGGNPSISPEESTTDNGNNPTQESHTRPLNSTLQIGLIHPVRHVEDQVVALDHSSASEALETYVPSPVEQTGLRCSSCKSDRQKCVWFANEAKCVRCQDRGYSCLNENEDLEADNKKRKLSRLKCDYCRMSKQKCLPIDREWPGTKCERCISKELPCSKPQTSASTRLTPAPEESSILQSPHPSALLRENQPSIMKAGSLTQPPANPVQTFQRLVREIIHKDSMFKKNSYRYPELGPGQDFRLLVLMPGQQSDPIKCKLIPGSFAESQNTYEALSYTWEPELPSHPISIISYQPGERFSLSNIRSVIYSIRSNLFAALVALRSPTSEVVLWIDTLCVDDENVEEKSFQVSIVPRIFSSASNVCVWLGSETPQAQDAAGVFGLIRAMLDFNQLEQLLHLPQNAGHWHALVQLLSRDWFSRRWVIQEIAFAKGATVHYGNQTLSWDDFEVAISLLNCHEGRVREILLQWDNYGSAPELSLTLRLRSAYTLVEIISNIFRRSQDGKIMEKRINLETLVSSLLSFDSTDPRDCIYSILSIAKDTPLEILNTPSEQDASGPNRRPFIDRRITPDYRKTISEVFIGFVEYCVEKSKSLDIICRYWAPRRKGRGMLETSLDIGEPGDELPSWILPISLSAFGGPAESLNDRLNGDEFVGAPTLRSSKNYNAAAGLLPECRFGLSKNRNDSGTPLDTDGQPVHEDMGDSENTSIGATSARDFHFSESRIPENPYDGCLFVKGVLVDIIHQVSPRMIEGIIPQECLELLGWSVDEPTKRVPEHLWRMLVADRGPAGINPPLWYSRACLQCLRYTNHNGDLSTGTWIEKLSSVSLVSFLQRVQAVTWNRRFIKTEGELPQSNNQPLLGLVPAKSKKGDIVAILFGCSVPAVLRPHKTGDDEYWEFIGEAYIHGIMDGEEVAGKNFHPPYEGAKTFKLR